MKNKIETKQSSLTKFLAQAGVASRRKAVLLVEEGLVTVNGIIVYEPGYKVSDGDTIKVRGVDVVVSDEKIYLLLNKPKGYITTVSDEKGRKTVMDLISGIGKARVYPIGRLDRNSTGVLLITNDGLLAEQLAHPRNEILKKYHVTLDKVLLLSDVTKIKKGVMLEDGLVVVDELHYIRGSKSTELTIHSGRYRVIRRLFEQLGYDVVKLDRIEYAGLTKKGVPAGSWRYLNQSEVEKLYQQMAFD